MTTSDKTLVKHLDKVQLTNEQLNEDKKDLTIFMQENLSRFIKDKKDKG